MDPDGSLQIISLMILIATSAFFSSSETAFMALNKIRLRTMQENEEKNSNIIAKLLDDPNRLLGSLLVGNNLVNIAASAIATSYFMEVVGKRDGVWISTLVMTILVLIFGEVMPKSFAANSPEKATKRAAKPVRFFVFLFYPVTKIISCITTLLAKLAGADINAGTTFVTAEDLKAMVNVSHEEGVLEVEERKMLHNVFEFGDSQAKDAMTTRTDMIAVDVEDSYDEIIALFKKEQYSRMPVYRDTPDDIIGVFYLKDIILKDIDTSNFNIVDIMREPFFTYEFKKTRDLLEEMREKRTPIAIVLDEYGGTSGLITIEDLVEEIVGDIADEFDIQDEEIKPIKENEFIVDGGTRIDAINELFEVEIVSEDFDSIGGYILGELGRLPVTGESIERFGLTIDIESVGKNRIEQIRITK